MAIIYYYNFFIFIRSKVLSITIDKHFIQELRFSYFIPIINFIIRYIKYKQNKK